MFQSNRFNTVVTNETRERLLCAQNNSPPIAQGESHRGAVVAIQSAIAALNPGYMLGSGIDGFFGPRTGNAVEAFQRDYGLVADRIVGKQTLNQLDSLFSGGMSLEEARFRRLDGLARDLHLTAMRLTPADRQGYSPRVHEIPE